jgi:hypothetical protein
VADQWFSPGILHSSTNKTNCHDIAEILLKVALNTITLTPNNLYSAVVPFLKNIIDKLKE